MKFLRARGPFTTPWRRSLTAALVLGPLVLAAAHFGQTNDSKAARDLAGATAPEPSSPRSTAGQPSGEDLALAGSGELNDFPGTQDEPSAVALGGASRAPAEDEESPLQVAAFDLSTPPPAPLADLERALPVKSFATAGLTTTAVLRAESAPAALSVLIEVAPGDTLMGLLTREGVERSDAHQAVAALQTVFSPKGLKPGQQIRLTLAPGDESLASFGEEPSAPLLVSMTLQPSADQDVQVVRAEDGAFQAQAVERPLQLDLVGHRGIIDDSLFAAATSNGVPVSALVEMIRVFSYDVDFQREIQPGDSFEIIYEAYYDETGALAKTGQIEFASLTLSGKRIDLYGFTPSSGVTDFFDPKGQSVRKALLRTPVDGARISSNFGMRKHPILGYSKMHKGVDFAVPTGTPIYAAGDGVVEMAGWNGGYGNYVRIKHNGTYKTAYAHMSKIGKGVSKGSRVRQGEVIGYVGSTGQSTGPHLHYEVLIDNKQVNPLDIKLPAGEKLAGKDLEAFKARMAEIDRLRRTKSAPLVAETPGVINIGDTQ